MPLLFIAPALHPREDLSFEGTSKLPSCPRRLRVVNIRRHQHRSRVVNHSL